MQNIQTDGYIRIYADSYSHALHPLRLSKSISACKYTGQDSAEHTDRQTYTLYHEGSSGTPRYVYITSFINTK